MSDYGFMRTGLLDDGNSPADNLTSRLLSLVSVLMEHVVQTASKYAEHAGRRHVLRQDVHYALQHESRVFFSRPDIDRVPCVDLFASSSSDEDHADISQTDISQTDSVEVSQPEAWTRSTCECEFCCAVHRNVDTWGEYSPEDEALAFLKRHTDTVLAM